MRNKSSWCQTSKAIHKLLGVFQRLVKRSLISGLVNFGQVSEPGILVMLAYQIFFPVLHWKRYAPSLDKNDASLVLQGSARWRHWQWS